MHIPISLFVFFIVYVHCSQLEPVCSKFDYEYKTLEAMLRTERNVEDMRKEMLKIQDDVNDKLQQLNEFTLKNEQAFAVAREKLDTRIVHMKKESEKMSKKIDSELDEVKKELNEQVFEMQNETKSIYEKIGSELDTLRDKYPEMEGSTRGEIIAFSVADPTKSSTNGVPTFSREITIVGDGYNLTTGKFTCTVPGLYMFTLNVASTSSTEQVYCRIQLNSKDVVISFSHHLLYTSASNTVFLLLSKGDFVSPGNCGSLENFYTSYGAMSFSGALISHQ